MVLGVTEIGGLMGAATLRTTIARPSLVSTLTWPARGGVGRKGESKGFERRGRGYWREERLCVSVITQRGWGGSGVVAGDRQREDQ